MLIFFGDMFFEIKFLDPIHQVILSEISPGDPGQSMAEYPDQPGENLTGKDHIQAKGG